MAASVYNLVFRPDTVIELTDTLEEWPTSTSTIPSVESSPDTVQDIEYFSIHNNQYVPIGGDNVVQAGGRAFMLAGTGKEVDKTNSKAAYYNVSAGALVAASPVFRDMLSGSNIFQKEGAKIHICARGLNARALLYVLAIFHNRPDKLPDKVLIYKLGQIAVVVDALKCQEAVKIRGKMWCDAIKDLRCVRLPMPSEPFRGEHLLWLWATYVFRRADEFKKITEIFLRRAEDEPYLTLRGVPIDNIILAIREKRRETLEEGVGTLFDWCNHYESASYKCKLHERYSIGCGSIMAAALKENMAKLGIEGDRELMRYPDNFSIQKLCSGVIYFQEPARNTLDHQHSCSFKEIKNNFMFHTSTVELDDVPPTGVASRTKGRLVHENLTLRLRSPTAS